MKVGMILKKFEPKTGKSRHVVEVSKRINGMGVQVVLITSRIEWNPADPDLGCLKIYEIGGPDLFLYFRAREIRRILEKENVDLIEIHGNLAASLVLPMFNQVCNRPIIFNIHSSPVSPYELRNLSLEDFWFDRRYVLDVDDIVGLVLLSPVLNFCFRGKKIKAAIVASKLLRQRVGRASKLRCYHIPSGADVHKFMPRIDLNVHKHQSSHPRSPTIFFYSRAVMVRGIDTLIKAFEKVKERLESPRLVLMLLPDVDAERVDKIVKNSPFGSDIVCHIGYREGIHQDLAEADVVVLPFRTTGCIPEQPLTLLEAMSCEKPVITTSIGSLPEIVKHKENGLLVEPNDSESLAEAIVELLQNQELASELARNARQTVVSDFNWDVIAQDTLSVYRKVLNG